MLAQLAVVEPDHQPQPGIEPTGGQRGTDVRLVVVIHESQRRGPLRTSLAQRLLRRLCGFHFPYREQEFTTWAGPDVAAVRPGEGG